MSADVPRRAVFDDLRVGQWVAWCYDEGPIAGVVESVSAREIIAHGFADDAPYSFLPADVERGEVTILRDAPAPPVTVRREWLESDEWAEALYEHRSTTPPHWPEVTEKFPGVAKDYRDWAKAAACALIDNAE